MNIKDLCENMSNPQRAFAILNLLKQYADEDHKMDAKEIAATIEVF